MNAASILPELEVFDVGMADFASVMVAESVLTGPLYFNILLGNFGTAAFNLRNASAIINALFKPYTWSTTGIGQHQLAANVLSIAIGGNV